MITGFFTILVAVIVVSVAIGMYIGMRVLRTLVPDEEEQSFQSWTEP